VSIVAGFRLAFSLSFCKLPVETAFYCLRAGLQSARWKFMAPFMCCCGVEFVLIKEAYAHFVNLNALFL
jgi:hypothetical protein